jgi:hypothetical protein
MLNNVVGLYFLGAYIRVGFYSGGLIFGGGGGAYLWNDVRVSIWGGLIFVGAYIRGGGGLYSGGAYSRRFTVTTMKSATKT